MQRGKKNPSLGISEVDSRLSRNWYSKLEKICKLELKSGLNVVEPN